EAHSRVDAEDQRGERRHKCPPEERAPSDQAVRVIEKDGRDRDAAQGFDLGDEAGPDVVTTREGTAFHRRRHDRDPTRAARAWQSKIEGGIPRHAWQRGSRTLATT